MSALTPATTGGAVRSIATRALVIAGVIVVGACGSERTTAPEDDTFTASARPERSSTGRRSTDLLSPSDQDGSRGQPASTPSATPRGRVLGGTPVAAWLETPLDTGAASVGDVVRATIIVDVLAEDHHVGLPSGAVMSGTVTAVRSAVHSGDTAFLKFRFDRATLRNGSSASIRVEEGVNSDGWTGRGAALTPTGTPDADLISQLIGPGMNPREPAAEDTGLLLSRRRAEIILGAGSVLNLLLDGDVILTEPAASRASFP